MVGNRKRAIIADDDDFFRLALNAILSNRFDFDDIIETSSFDEALSKLDECENSYPATLALIDLRMPGMAGAHNLGAVRRCFPSTRVAMVSGSTFRKDILLALEAGAHGYIPKGLGAAELTKAIGIILDGSIYTPACLADLSDGPLGVADQLSGERLAGHDSATPNGEIDKLTPRQREVLFLVTAGKSNKEIARSLALSEGTVKVHVAAMLRVFNVENRAGIAAAGARLPASA